MKLKLKHAVIDLAENVQGQLRAADFSEERIKDMREHLKEGDEISAKIANIDRKNRVIYLTMRETVEQAPAKPRAKPEAPATTTLGDLFKEQIESKKEE